ncbi:DUF378 domain-containing protein [Candidatus Babeliales bacterium]|nr:DUF378 domain-containing protein [Candidatus Babeliales bacterium]
MFYSLTWFSGLFSAIGAMNWGLVAFFGFDLVRYLTRLLGVKYVDKILYGVIALSGVFSLLALFSSPMY